MLTHVLLAMAFVVALSSSVIAAGPTQASSEAICSQAYVILCENFETRDVGVAWPQGNDTGYKNTGWGAYAYDCMAVTNDPAGVYDGSRAFVEIYYENSTGCANIYWATPGWLQGTNYTDLYYRWYVKESSNFQLSTIANKFTTWRDNQGNEGGHMSGMRYNTMTTVAAIGLFSYGWAHPEGGGTGGCDARAINPWPTYPTLPAPPGWQCELGPNMTASTAPWVPGHWYCEEIHIKLNSCENCSDGIYEKWLDDATVTPVTTQTQYFNYRNTFLVWPYYIFGGGPPVGPNADYLKLSGFVAMSFWNCAAGDLPESAAPPNNICYNAAIGPGSPASNPASLHPLMYRYKDNIVIATQRIGCLGNPQPCTNCGGSPPPAPVGLQVTKEMAR